MDKACRVLFGNLCFYFSSSSSIFYLLPSPFNFFSISLDFRVLSVCIAVVVFISAFSKPFHFIRDVESRCPRSISFSQKISGLKLMTRFLEGLIIVA